MTLLPVALLQQIRQVASEFSVSTLEAVTYKLSQGSPKAAKAPWETHLLSSIPNPQLRQQLWNLICCWRAEAPEVDSFALASALSVACYCTKAEQKENAVELVWTGPDPIKSSPRRTEQALIQIIQSAQEHLLIVSFAIYHIPEIESQLLAALDRGVVIQLVAETPQSNSGKIPFGVETLSWKLLQRIQVYIWPVEKRPTDDRGRYGSLHVKCAICDMQFLFISSANLTNYALNLNMEMGLLVHHSPTIRQAKQHFEQLIQAGTLVPISPQTVS